MPRLSRCRSSRPPSSLRSAPYGAQSDPLPTDPAGPRRSPDLSAAPDRAPSPNGRRRSRTRSRLTRTLRALILAVTTAAALALLTTATAGAATLVSNTGQVADSGPGQFLSAADAAQAFTTGPNGATLTGVTIKFNAAPESTTTVTAFIADGRSATDSIIANLTNPGTWSTTSTFSASSGTTLDANTTYYLFISSDDGDATDEDAEGKLTMTTASNEDSGAAPGWSIGITRYLRQVRSTGLGGTFISNLALRMQFSIQGDLIITAPDKPTGVTVGTVTPSKIPLTWTAPSFNGGASITSYTVERAPDDSTDPGNPDDANWTSIGTASTTSYTDSDLTPETTYHYRVSATNSEGTGDASDPVSGTTNALPVVTIAATNATRTEGRSVDFDLALAGDTSELTSVNLRFEPTGDFLDPSQTSAYNTTLAFTAGATTARSSTATDNDALDEENGSLKATVRTGDGYTVGATASATVDIFDNDTVPSAPVVTALGWDTKLVLRWDKPAQGTVLINRYDYRYKTTAGAESTWSAWTNTGITVTTLVSMHEFQISGLTNGTDYTAEVRARSVAGIGAAGSGNSTPTVPAMITGVAITSDPGSDDTYAIGEDIVITLTFNKALSIAGTDTTKDPGYITYQTDYASDNPSADEPEAACVVGADTMTLACTDTIVEGRYDTDGISVNANSLTDFGSISAFVGPNLQRVSSTFAALPVDSDHKIDGIRPTLSSADADQTDLTKVILTFSEAVKLPDATKITVKKGVTVQLLSGPAVVDAMDATKVVVTLSAALMTTDTNVTVDLAADAVKDVPGNGIAEVLGTSVSVEDTVAPTFVSAGTNDTDEVVLTYSETLNTTAPATSAFTVKVGGSNRGVDTVAISGSAVTLTLASAFRPGDTLTVSLYEAGEQPDQGRGGQRGGFARRNDGHQQPRRHRPGGAANPGRGRCPCHGRNECIR